MRQLKPRPESVGEEDEGDDENNMVIASGIGGAAIVLNSTSEFCRSLGEIPTYGQAGNRAEEEKDELLVGKFIFFK